MQTRDSLDRALPNAKEKIDLALTPSETDIWATLEPLNIHGPLNTFMLEAFALLFKNDGLWARKRISWLSRSKKVRYNGESGGPVLCRPDYQFPVDKRLISRMTITYDLSERGEEILRRAGRYHPIPHSGWWQHQRDTAHVTASLHLGVLEDEKNFITPDKIAKDIGHIVPFEITVNNELRRYESIKYVPDYLFGVDRYYIVELDRGNEVGKASEPHVRKTLERMVLQIMAFIGDGLYHEACNLPTNKPMLALIVSTHQSKLALIERIILEKTKRAKEPGCNYILLKHVPPEAFSPYKSPKPLDLWTTPWKRAGRSDFYLNNPERQ